ncbi:MAG: D-alanyl-D-alanine carboxypeptidase, partial [Lachnospiraceae bacterium]|nr:D-alanyl-D-alanine carboxypeptidase [Lachnospiraceae bacterium]
SLLLHTQAPFSISPSALEQAGYFYGVNSVLVGDATTGEVYYQYQSDTPYPIASTTKLMTCLIAAEKCQLGETIKFSHDAIFSLEPGSSNMGIDEGQAMPLEECLYGILVASANEVANAVAEHIAGSRDAFAEMMNEKAAELGCKNTHFVNAHGLHDDDHYVSAYDLALIAKAFFQNELLAKIGNTASYHFKPTATQPDDFIKRNKHQLITGEIPYEGMKGGKTGYTDLARQTLVSCAEQNGMKLICVILKEESPEQFYDTVKLFDYGFTNFSVVNVAENETRYSIQNSNFFNTSSDVFGNSNPILSLNQNSYLIMPKNAVFSELDSKISYDTEDQNQVAIIQYYYHNAYLGTATLDLAGTSSISYEFTENSDAVINTEDQNVIVVNIKLILMGVLAIAVFIITIIIIRSFVRSYNFHNNRQDRRRKRLNKKNRKNGPHFPSSW